MVIGSAVNLLANSISESIYASRSARALPTGSDSAAQPVQRYLTGDQKSLLRSRSQGISKLLDLLQSDTPEPKLKTVANLLRSCDVSAHVFDSQVVRSAERGYCRNVIAKTQDYELAALVWRPGQWTPIHNHAGSACAFKVLSGPVMERTYEETAERTARCVSSNPIPTGTVGIAEVSDIHALGNQSEAGEGDRMNLHLYMPPIKDNSIYVEEKEVSKCTH